LGGRTGLALWWRGSGARDIDQYLAEFAAADGLSTGQVVDANGARCGGDGFAVRLDDETGWAERTCTARGNGHHVLDSVGTVDEADPAGGACPCGGETFLVAKLVASRAVAA
jgi:hypothetical protein